MVHKAMQIDRMSSECAKDKSAIQNHRCQGAMCVIQQKMQTAPKNSTQLISKCVIPTKISVSRKSRRMLSVVAWLM